jgi:hypothetical protein
VRARRRLRAPRAVKTANGFHCPQRAQFLGGWNANDTRLSTNRKRWSSLNIAGLRDFSRNSGASTFFTCNFSSFLPRRRSTWPAADASLRPPQRPLILRTAFTHNWCQLLYLSFVFYIISGTFNYSFELLFNFRSHYLFAIGVKNVFRFRWNIPPGRRIAPSL